MKFPSTLLQLEGAARAGCLAALMGLMGLMLAGCGDNGLLDSSTQDPVEPAPAERTGTVTLEGFVVKGPVRSATVCAYELVDGVRGRDVRLTITPGAPNTPAGGGYCVITSDTGSFRVTVPDHHRGDLLLESRDGFFCTDETPAATGGCASGGVKLRIWDAEFRTVIAVPAEGTLQVQISPLSTAAVDTVGDRISAWAFARRFATLVRQTLGTDSTVTPTTPPTLATHPYLKAAAVHLLAYGKPNQVVATLARGSTDFLPRPAPRPRVASTITLDFEAALRRVFTEGAQRRASLVIASRQLTYVWDSYVELEPFNGLDTAAATRRSELFDFTDGVHRRTRNSTRYFFSHAPFTIHGQIDGDGQQSVTTAAAPLPRAGRLGERGFFYRYVTYSDATRTEPVSTTEVHWSLQADTADTLLACLEAVTLTSAGGQTKLSECIPFDAMGRLTGEVGDDMRVIQELDGFTYFYEYRPEA